MGRLEARVSAPSPAYVPSCCTEGFRSSALAKRLGVFAYLGHATKQMCEQRALSLLRLMVGHWAASKCHLADSRIAASEEKA